MSLKRNQIRKCITLLGALLTSVSLLTAQPLAPPQNSAGGPKQANPSQLMQKRKKLRQISQQLSQIQQEAIRKEPVQKSLKKFEDKTYKKMIESAPDKKKAIKGLRSLSQDLREADPAAQKAGKASKEFKAKVQEYRQLKQKLRPVERKAMKDPEVTKLRSQFTQQLMATMKQINPETETLLAQRKQLAGSLRQQMRQTQQPKQPAPQDP